MNIYSFLASQVVIEKEIFKIQRVGVYQYPSSNEVRIIAKTPEESKKIYDTLLEIIKGNPSRIIIGLENNRIAAINPSAVLIAGSSEERIFTNSCSLSRFTIFAVLAS